MDAIFASQLCVTVWILACKQGHQGGKNRVWTGSERQCGHRPQDTETAKNI